MLSLPQLKNYYIMKTNFGQELDAFFDTFRTDLDCLQHLADFKWNADNSRFKCCKCGHNKCTIRKFNFARDCNKCHHIESPTAGTLFHKLKFGIKKALIVIFEMSTNTRAISASQMAKKIRVTRRTATYFMHKVRKAMEDNQIPMINGIAQVLCFAFGYKEDFRPKQSRNLKRKKIVVAVELSKTGGIKHTHFKAINNFSSKEIKKLFDSHIDKKAKVLVDQCLSFAPLKKEYNITAFPNTFKNFIQTNRIVHDLKTTLRSAYSSVKQKYMQRYLDEFSFKINYSNVKVHIFDLVLERMMKHQPVFVKQL